MAPTIRNELRRLLLPFLLFASLPASSTEWVYTVAEGDNLWDFSQRHLDRISRFESLRRINNIEFPRRMRPGTTIRVPMKWIRSNPVKARVSAVSGQVELTRGDGTRVTDVIPGTEIGLGDRLRTGTGASIAVRFADDSAITLHQQSELIFDHLSAHGQTGMVDSRTRLVNGRMDTQVTPAVGPGSRFEIHTPSAISAVRGTSYRAAVSPDREWTNFEVTGGRVKVSAADRSETLPRGFGTRVAVDRAPGKPRRLLPPPDLEPIPDRIRDAAWSLRWQPVQGADMYRVELSQDDSFQVLVWDRTVGHSRVPLPELADGRYHVRVRAIDGEGLEGFDRVAALLMDTHPRPPIPLRPRDGQVLRGEPAELSWSASADADHYLVEIAGDEGFSQVISSTDNTRTTRFATTGITSPGTYYWRVSSIAADGEVGPPGDERSWTLKPVPRQVEPSLSADENLLTASWRTSAPDAQYQVQLALDPAFTELQLDQLTDQPSFSFEATPGQVRYLRIRVIEADGYIGPWGAVQRIDPPPDPTAWMVPILGVIGILLL